MAKREKSHYQLQFSCDASLVEQLMQSYLRANSFQQIDKEGHHYYRSGDGIISPFRGLDYSIDGNSITIEAWLGKSYGGTPLNNKLVGAVPIMAYRNSLEELFREITNLNNEGNNTKPVQQSVQNGGQQTMSTSQFSQNFQDSNTKKRETMCEIGFWLSICGLLVAFGGISVSVIIYIIDFYFAAQGLKTRKRGKAIATIVMSCLSIVILVLQLLDILGTL